MIVALGKLKVMMAGKIDDRDTTNFKQDVIAKH